MGIKTKLMILVGMVFGTTVLFGHFFVSKQEEKLILQMAEGKSNEARTKILNGLFTLMVAKNYQQSEPFLSGMLEGEGLMELRVIRSPVLSRQYGAPPSSKQPRDDYEMGIFSAQSPLKQEVQSPTGEVGLQTIYPIAFVRNFVGTDCLSCHEGHEGMIAGGLVVSVPLEPFRDALRHDRFSMRMVTLALLVLVFLVIYSILTRYVEFPISRVVGVAQRIASGQLINEKIPIYSKDEIGKLAYAFEGMQESLIKLSNQAKILSQGDLTKRIDGRGDLPDAFNLMVDNLTNLVEDIREKSLQVDEASTSIYSNTRSQSEDVENQAMALEKVTVTMKELSNSATQIADKSTRVLNVAKKTLTSAESGRSAVDLSRKAMEGIRQKNEEVTQKVTELAEKTQQIANILDLINDIAAETKILAINASIEASRAGEAGKGFSVVANEIRKLAENVVNSTGSIRDLIEEIQIHSNESIQAIRENRLSVDQGSKTTVKVAQNLVEIVEIAKRTADTAHQISIATQEQNTASAQVLEAINEVAAKTQHFSEMARESTRQAETITNMSSELKEKVSKFQIHTNDRPAPGPGRPSTKSKGPGPRARASVPEEPVGVLNPVEKKESPADSEKAEKTN
jgi:methyl-accepting chemotaxis protein